jgi:hypothetical protein
MSTWPSPFWKAGTRSAAAVESDADALHELVDRDDAVAVAVARAERDGGGRRGAGGNGRRRRARLGDGGGGGAVAVALGGTVAEIVPSDSLPRLANTVGVRVADADAVGCASPSPCGVRRRCGRGRRRGVGLAVGVGDANANGAENSDVLLLMSVLVAVMLGPFGGLSNVHVPSVLKTLPSKMRPCAPLSEKISTVHCAQEVPDTGLIASIVGGDRLSLAPPRSAMPIPLLA